MSINYSLKEMEDRYSRFRQSKIELKKLYKADFVNWSGSTNNIKYSDHLAHLIFKDFDQLNSIDYIRRKHPYFVDTHNPNLAEINEVNEDALAKKIYLEYCNESHNSIIGRTLDYQVPLNNKRNDNAGKIDLVSYRESSNCIMIIELKREDNTETLLRAVLEIFTYYKLLHHSKFLADVSNKLPNNNIDKIIPVVLVDSNSKQIKEYYDTEGSKHLRELIKKLGVRIWIYRSISEMKDVTDIVK